MAETALASIDRNIMFIRHGFDSADLPVSREGRPSTTVIFPESPMNFMYETDPETREFIDGFARKNNVSVLFNSAEPDKTNGRFFNSAVMVGPQGGEVAQYCLLYTSPSPRDS